MAYDHAKAEATLSPTRTRPALRILLVEDNPVVQHAFADALQAAGVDVVGRAADERSAIQWLQDHPQDWDVAIVDLFLSSGSGVGVLRAATDRERHQKVLVLTNYITADLRSQCFALGANGVFDKAAQRGELMSLLQLL